MEDFSSRRTCHSPLTTVSNLDKIQHVYCIHSHQSSQKIDPYKYSTPLRHLWAGLGLPAWSLESMSIEERPEGAVSASEGPHAIPMYTVYAVYAAPVRHHLSP